ncbi:LysR substrate-binding domain-containing protein [Larsenimonas salina]|uniref:LysR substrate-binding domain-containing protein n=1 Tax=Larsenimonas salina TaxID=1295565 RepID=UPI0020741EBE|nr:LysR substrate-binding domain-containing protein [Larsenimonas salina]MCM5705126.1 LysR substrate-binding domain-containing protein [Larsenimonas salina]
MTCESIAMRFDLTSLNLFLAVAEEKSLTRASKRAHLAVSAISKRIAELEQHVGAPLFTRFSRGVELTPAGQSMLSYARQVFETLHLMEQELGDYSAGIKGQLRLHATTSSLAQFLPRDIETFSALYPGIRFDIEERVGAAIVRAVTDGRADLGIFASRTPAPDLETIHYRSDELAVAVSLDHALAERDMVRFSEVTRYEFIASHAESALYALATQEAAKLHLSLKVRIRVSSFDCMCQLVAGRLGIAILPLHVIRIYAQSLPIVGLTLDESWAKRDLQIGMRSFSSLPATARAFVEHLGNSD